MYVYYVVLKKGYLNSESYKMMLFACYRIYVMNILKNKLTLQLQKAGQ